MLNRLSVALLLCLFFISAPGPAVGDIIKDVAKKAADAAFSEAERQVIEKYYKVTAPTRDRTYRSADDDDYGGDRRKNEHKKKDKEKGYSKKKDLPKGIRKKLERGGTLPPGIAKRYLPGDLERQLPPAPSGYERIETDGQVLLRNITTGVIADIVNIGMKSTKDMGGEKTVEKSKPRAESATTEKSERKWWQFWKH